MRSIAIEYNEIPKGSIVEHCDSGQQGVVIGYSRFYRCATRHHVKWDDVHYETPGGVVAARLIIIKRAK